MLDWKQDKKHCRVESPPSETISSRAQRFRHAGVLAAEKFAENRIVEKLIARHRLDALGINIDHRRPHFLHHRRERDMEFARILRRNLLGGLRGCRRAKKRENKD
jgi:hypothetical protein